MDITVIENNETMVIKFTNKIRTRRRKEKKKYIKKSACTQTTTVK